MENTMGNFIKKYLQLLLFILGVAITAACAFWVKNTEATLISAAITISSETILFSFQSANSVVADKFASDFKHFFMETYLDIKQDMENMDKRWKSYAYDEIESTRAKIKKMAAGIQDIEQAKSITYVSESCYRYFSIKGTYRS